MTIRIRFWFIINLFTINFAWNSNWFPVSHSNRFIQSFSFFKAFGNQAFQSLKNQTKTHHPSNHKLVTQFSGDFHLSSSESVEFKRISMILQSVSRCSTESPLCLWPIRSKSLQTMPTVIEYSLRNTSRRKRKAHCILNRMSHAVTWTQIYCRTRECYDFDCWVKSHLNYRFVNPYFFFFIKL